MNEFTIVRGLFDTRKRSLIIDENCIKYENRDRKDDLFTVINREDIAGIRYGIHFIKGLEFYIGREYLIFIRDQSNKEIKINFKLFYGIKLQEKHQLYHEIVDEIWGKFISSIAQSYLEKFKNNETFNLSGVRILNDRVQFDKSEILINDLDVKKYNHYFMLYTVSDHYTNKMLYYLKDKDAVILLDLLTGIIKMNQ